MKIAGNKTVCQWEDLEQTLKNENNTCWGRAFGFFEERMETRYLKPIEAILKIRNNNGKGFAVVNLQCSLIETIESFIKGAISSNTGKTIWKNKEGDIIFRKNEEIFKSFFGHNNLFESLNINSKDFYVNVRCGLLHETQTKNGWEIRVGKEGQKSIVGKIIYREALHSDIKTLIEKYKLAIVEGAKFREIRKEDLRQNFRNKFNHLCKISK